MGKEAVEMLCPLPHPLSLPQIQLANVLTSFFAILPEDILHPKEYTEPQRAD